MNFGPELRCGGLLYQHCCIVANLINLIPQHHRTETCWNLFPSPRLKVMWSITWLVSVSPSRSAYPKVVRAHSNYVYKTCSMHQYEWVPLPPNFHPSSYFEPTKCKSECQYYLPLCTVGASSTRLTTNWLPRRTLLGNGNSVSIV